MQVLQQPQYRGKALPGDHPDSKLVQKIAERIISAVEEGHGGGFQKHIEKFEWEVRHPAMVPNRQTPWHCHRAVWHMHWHLMMHCYPSTATWPIPWMHPHVLDCCLSNRIVRHLALTALAMQLSCHGGMEIVAGCQPTWSVPIAVTGPFG